MRAGGQALSLLGTPRIFPVLRSLSEGAKGQLELRRGAGSPASSTLRSHLAKLEDARILEKRRRESSPSAFEYDLTPAGRELLVVVDSLGRWLGDAPQGPIELGGDPAKAAIKGLVDGWSTGMIGALATESLSLTELDKGIPNASYPTLERCLQTMRLAEQIEAGDRGNRGTPYMVTEWLRRGVGPIIAAACWEHRNQIDGGDPVCQDDVDDAFALIAPTIALPARLNGIVQLVAKASSGKKQRRFMAFFEIRNGGAAFGSVYPQSEPDGWASGTLEAWFSTLVDGAEGDIELSGDRQLAGAVVKGLREALFSVETGAAAAGANRLPSFPSSSTYD